LHPYNKTYDYYYVDQQSQLDALCVDYANESVLAIDTEFVRTETLTPLLGLIQVFDGKRVALIDPVAIDNLNAFADILADESIVKVAHSCSEDLEALWHHLKVIPAPIFDTQFAAGLLDLGTSVGYANLVEQLFEIQIDKGESRTDWIRRPLTDAQCEYASADVTHLMALYEYLSPKIDERGMTSWVYQEIEQLALKKSLPVSPAYVYLNLKNTWKLNKRNLAAFQKLAQWRLELARKENKSVNFVIKEVALFEIAMKLPQTSQALFDCQNLYSRQARLYSDALLNICRESSQLSLDACPPKVQRLIEFSAYKKAMALLKARIDKVAETYQIPVATLASKKQMNQVLKWYWFDLDDLAEQGIKPDILTSWRFQLLSADIIDIQPQLAEQHEIKRSLPLV
jgi:ribonuclease D